MVFKPLTRSKTELKTNSEATPNPHRALTPTQIKDQTDERIYIIYDDSGSMETEVYEHNISTGTQKALGSRIKLAVEATTEYLKNCKPHKTAVEIKPLNTPALSLTINIPNLASQLKTIEATGGTPLYEHLKIFLERHKEANFTRALIFTDGEAYAPYDAEEIFERLLVTKVPIDLIIISDTKTNLNLNYQEQRLKAIIEQSKGTFLICKDGKVFKEKMKFFAPFLRHLLPAIASEAQ